MVMARETKCNKCGETWFGGCTGPWRCYYCHPEDEQELIPIELPHRVNTDSIYNRKNRRRYQWHSMKRSYKLPGID